MRHGRLGSISLTPIEGTQLSAGFDALMQAGLEASRRDDVDAAVQAWRSAAAAKPDSALPHFLMGAEYAQAKRLAEAEAAFANAVLLAPGFETARYQLGLLQFTSGRAAVAHVTWEPLLHLPDAHPLRSFVLGFAALAQDDFDAALSYFQAGIDANQSNLPMNKDIRQVVAAIHRLRGQEEGAAMPGADVNSSEEDAHILLASYRQSSLH